MGQLRDRMDADLRLRGLSENTRRLYLRCARDFAVYCGPFETASAGSRRPMPVPSPFAKSALHGAYLPRSDLASRPELLD